MSRTSSSGLCLVARAQHTATIGNLIRVTIRLYKLFQPCTYATDVHMELHEMQNCNRCNGMTTMIVGSVEASRFVWGKIISRLHSGEI